MKLSTFSFSYYNPPDLPTPAPPAPRDIVWPKEKIRGVLLNAGFGDNRPETQRMATTIPASSKAAGGQSFCISEMRLTCLTHHMIQKEEKHKMVKGKRKGLSCFLRLQLHPFSPSAVSSSHWVTVTSTILFTGIKLSVISLRHTKKPSAPGIIYLWCYSFTIIKTKIPILKYYI